MATRFYSRALRSIDKILRLDGPQVLVESIDLASPLSPTFDVSRIAQLGGAATQGGFFNASFTNTHGVVASTIHSFFDVLPASAFWTILQLNPEEHWIWLHEVTVRVGSALVLTEGIFEINHAVVVVSLGFTNHRRVTHLWNGVTGEISSNGSGLNAAKLSTQAPPQVKLPTVIPSGSRLTFTSVASGAVEDIVGQALLQVVPIGCGPFGAG